MKFDFDGMLWPLHAKRVKSSGAVSAHYQVGFHQTRFCFTLFTSDAHSNWSDLMS